MMATPMVLEPADATAADVANRSARKAITLVWFAFVIAFVISSYLRYERTGEAVGDLVLLAQIVDQRIDAGDGISAIADDLAENYLEEKKRPIEADQLRTLVKGLAYQIQVDKLDPKLPKDPPPTATQSNGTESASGWDELSLRAFIHKTLFNSLLVLSVIHGAILASFPAFFTMTARQARKHIRNFSPTGPDEANVRTDRLADTFWNGVWYRRHVIFLESETKLYVGRRLGFALLASLSLTYMLAPSGLYSAAVGEYMTLSGVPGRASNPFWFAEFAQASPFVLGLLGFLVYSLLTIARRGISYDVSSNLFLSLWNRGITVVILSLVLTAIDPESTFLKALIFVAGVFPETGLQAIGKIAQTGTDRLAELKPKGLTEIPDIDSIKEGSLRELGIYSVFDLAQTDLSWLMVASRIHPRVLLKAMDRAILIDRLGSYQKELEKLPAYTASDLVLYVYGQAAYSDRWAKTSIKKCRELGLDLDDAEQKKRRQVIADQLDVKDIEVHTHALRAKTNLWFILDNRLTYEDL